MTDDSKLPITIDELLIKAEGTLTTPKYNMLKAYIESGRHQLAPDTAIKFFELYLNGIEPEEIHRLNKAFPYEAILWAQVKFSWNHQKDEYIAKLSTTIRDKVIKAQLETTGLLTDLLSAANKHHGDKVKKYLQTGDQEDLKGALSIDSVGNLLKIVDGLAKITGQDKVHTVKTQNTQTLNLNVNAGKHDETMDAETAAELLSVISKSKKKKESE